MAIEIQHDLSNLTVDELYVVYRAVAIADHQMRTEALYGDVKPPPGHYEHRPLPRADFGERFRAAERLVGGPANFRGRLARQAAAYRVDTVAVIAGIAPLLNTQQQAA